MIRQIYLVEVGSYIGHAATYEEALEMEKRYKCYTEDCKPFTITAEESREIERKWASTIIKNDDYCVTAATHN